MDAPVFPRWKAWTWAIWTSGLGFGLLGAHLLSNATWMVAAGTAFLVVSLVCALVAFRGNRSARP
jgi:hypothetical protein